jgi:hypothetical protein
MFKRSLIALVLYGGVTACAISDPDTPVPSAAVTTWWGEPISELVTVETGTATTWWGEPISNVVAVAAVGQ